MMRCLVLMAGLAAPFLVAFGCASLTGPADPANMDPSSIVLARVGDKNLSLRDAMDTFLSSHAGHAALVTGEPAVRELAGRIVERQLFLAEARALHVPEDPLVEEAVAEHRLELAVGAFWKREIEGQVHVPDEEVEAFYAKTDLALRLSLVEVADRDQAEALRSRVEAGEDIAELARTFSTHSSKSFGGELPFVRRGELDPALEGPAFELTQPGELSPVIKTATGYTFVRLIERLENANRPERDVAIPQIRGVLEERARKARRAEVEQQVLAEVETSMDESLSQPEPTRALILGKGDEGRIVAHCGEETLTLGALRLMLNLERVAAASPEELAPVVPAIMENWIKKQAVRRAVRASGLLDDSAIVAQTEKYRDDLTMSVLHDRYVFANIKITEDDVRAYYEKHLEDEFTRPPEVRLAHILVASEAEAQAILERVRAGEDFSAIAREVSLDEATAFHAGRVGWVRPGQVLPEIDERAFALKVGEFDGPIKSEHGYHVIQVMDRRESMVVPFELAKSAARRRLLKEDRQELHDDWAKRLAQRADIELYDRGIDQAVAWLDAQAAKKAEQKNRDQGAESDSPSPLLRQAETGETDLPEPSAPGEVRPAAGDVAPDPGAGDSGEEAGR